MMKYRFVQIVLWENRVFKKNVFRVNIFILCLSVSLFILSSCGSSDDTEPIDEEEIIEENKPVQVQEDPFAFPGAEGFGRVTAGGRGGQVIKVTNLNDNGPGSFRQAVSTFGPRIIVFEVSGNIELGSNIVISHGNITIAGQTAPGDGITLKNYSLIVNANEVIIRYMRFRMGDEGASQGDALEGRYKKNIILDHCSMSWSTDETASFYGNENFTLQWCILSESLRNSVHEKGNHGYGGIWGGNNASFHHNLLAHHDNRNPRFDHPGVYSSSNPAETLRGVVDFRNNVLYNWGTDASYGGEAGTFNMIANYYKPGPATQVRRRFLNAYKQATNSSPVYGYGKFFIAGNILENQPDINADNWIGVVAKNGSSSDKTAMRLSGPLTTDGMYISNHTAQQAFDKVALYAGASLKRDAVDARIVNDLKNGTFFGPGSRGSQNGIIDSQNDVGGYPTLQSSNAPLDTDNDGMPDAWEIANKLDPNVANANGRDLSTAYDNIEVYINSLVKSITDSQN